METEQLLFSVPKLHHEELSEPPGRRRSTCCRSGSLGSLGSQAAGATAGSPGGC